MNQQVCGVCVETVYRFTESRCMQTSGNCGHSAGCSTTQEFILVVLQC